jgi:hypothetical protein
MKTPIRIQFNFSLSYVIEIIYAIGCKLSSLSKQHLGSVWNILLFSLCKTAYANKSVFMLTYKFPLTKALFL